MFLECTGKLTAPYGSFTSPNYPKNYDNKLNCSWLIEVPESHVIELKFDDVDLYKDFKCQNYIKVFDGNSSLAPNLTHLCGSQKPNNTIKSSTNQLFVEFRSGTYFTGKGFKITYITVRSLFHMCYIMIYII